MNTALVEMFNSQPMTTSLIIAEQINIQHKNVISIARKYINQLQKLGLVAFETRLNPQGSATEFLWFNESQAMFFLTLQKNSELIVNFKLSLVQAFMGMRDRLSKTSPHTNNPLTLSHRADIRVAADRTFRSVMRACRAGGARLPQALRMANQVTLSETGINVIDEYELVVPEKTSAINYRCENAMEFFNAWTLGQLPVPYTCCRSSDVYKAYRQWAIIHQKEILPINQVNACLTRDLGLVVKTKRLGDECVRMVFVPSSIVKNWHDIKAELRNFTAQLVNWENA